MRRRLSEQPRLVAAQLLLALTLVGAGYAVARAAPGEDKVPSATAAALDRARAESRKDKRAVRDAQATAERRRSQVIRERRRSTSLRRRNRALRAGLTRARRALRRERARSR